MRNIIICLLLIASLEVSCVIYPSIPSYLLPCYRGGGRPEGAPRRLDVLLNLLRRLENNSQLDLRMFSTSVLRSFRLDGIEQAENAIETEFVTPYRASAFQFHKYKLLMDTLLPSQGVLDNDLLTTDEQCILHRMLSSTVARWERGDENVMCPMSVEQRQTQMPVWNVNTTRALSRCPIEEGVIQTEWGTISPGTVIAGVAASLETQNVLVRDILNETPRRSSKAEPLADDDGELEIETLTSSLRSLPQTDINNVWAATLAGDLAEVSINQGPRVGASSQRMVVGSNNRWNDTFLPRNYYLFLQDQNVINWHFTDAEILAGIDGFILARHIPSWVSQRATIRLSQILDMYYSEDGVSFKPEVRACNRSALFKEAFNNDEERLLNEMTNFAHVLAVSQGTVFVLGEEMKKINKAAVDALLNYIPSLLERNKHPCLVGNDVPSLNLIVATDGSWTGYDVERFMSWLGGASATGWSRGSLSLLHGNTGDWLVSSANNLTAFFGRLHNTTVDWPNRLNFPNVLSAVMQYLENATLSEALEELSAASSTVVLVLSPADRPSDTEIETASTLMSTLALTYFDVYFAYVGQDLDGYRNMNVIKELYNYSELFLEVESTRVEEAIRVVRAQIIRSQIPKRIIGPHCNFNDTVYRQRPYEDFILSNRKNKYRIHPYYLKEQPSVNIQFRGTSMGTIMVCSRRGLDSESALSCREVAPHTHYWFNISSPCPSADLCPPIYFNVVGLSTLNMCANNDCRTPSEVSYYIEHTNLRCLSLRNNAVDARPVVTFIYIYICYFLSVVFK